MPPIRIALLGAHRSGKTRLATELAALLNCPPAAEPNGAAPIFHVDDNPPLLQRISAGLYGQDGVQAAQQHASDYRMTLLMGMDLGAAGTATAGNGQLDQAIRKFLTSARIDYQVIYGQHEQRLAHALHTLASLHHHAASVAMRSTGTLTQGLADQPPAHHERSGWVWVCDKCSDPVCEHRLLTDLLSRRSAADEPSLQR